MGNTTTYVYDSLNRIIKNVYADGREATYTYRGTDNVDRITDATGRSNALTYDSTRRLLSRSDSDGNTTSYMRDLQGQITSSTTPEGNTTSYEYDLLGRMIRSTEPSGKVTANTFEKSGWIRSVSGRPDFNSGHIPTAGFADLLYDLSDNDSPFQFSLLTPAQFSAAMGALGVGDESRVVLYDRTNSVWAARVWWMLRWVGFDRVALLDGGLGAWTAEGRPLSTEPANQPARQLTPAPHPELIADRDEVLAAIDNDNVNLIDALPESHYRGDLVLYGRTGHIPGASNVPASQLLDESGRYRPLDELAAMLNFDRNNRAITYCGGGIAASSDAFIMTRLGFTDVSVYIASLQEWAADFDNPMVVDVP